MKNLLIYINPSKKFQGENEILIKIQIDNSLDLGWNSKDIVLVTNFGYEYRGIKSIVISDDNYCYFDRISTKTYSIPAVFEKGIVGDDLYWLHDLDAFQLEVITEEELELGGVDLALCDRGFSYKWAGGTYFLRKGARDIFEKLKKKMDEDKDTDENTLLKLLGYEIPEGRYKKLNITYGFTMMEGYSPKHKVYHLATKPIKVIHFHPLEVRHHVHVNRLDLFMHGKNEMGVVLMTDRIIKIFNKHGIK